MILQANKSKPNRLLSVVILRLPEVGSAMVLLGASIFEQMKDLAPEPLSWVYEASNGKFVLGLYTEYHPT